MDRRTIEFTGCLASLTHAGFSAAEAACKVALLGQALEALGPPEAGPLHGLFVPGRIEVLGKHTDYAGGRSLLCAAERGICFAAAPRPDGRVVIIDARANQHVEGRIADNPRIHGPAWATYPRAVVRRLARNFPAARRGATVAFASDLPPAAGMSSSSAFVVGLFLALAAVNDLDAAAAYRANISSQEDLAAYLAAVENGASFRGLAGDRGVGTSGGSEDHTAILSCRAATLSQFAFCPTRLERLVRLPGRLVFAIAASGVAAEKTGRAREAYNRAAAAAARILELADAGSGRHASLADACTASPGAIDAIRRLLARSADAAFPSAMLVDRFEQFVAESFEVIPGAAAALAAGDLDTFGRFVDRSQQLAEARLGNQVPETTQLARSARELGAQAASAFGAGFGGSVWALVARDEAGAFIDRWRAAYALDFPGAAERAEFFTSGAGPGTVRWTLSVTRAAGQ